MTADVTPRPRKRTFRPGLAHERAMQLAATEYERVIATLEMLDDEDWARQTECPGWDVRAMAGHIVGMGELGSSLRQLARQQVVSTWRASRRGMEPLDALTALQVEEHAGPTPAALVEQLREVAPRAVRGRSRLLGPLRSRITIPYTTDGVAETWTLAFLFETVLTRDPFMHRLDIARATGVQVPPTAAHEGVIVADVVAEWAARHGEPYVLDLTGVAGGRWEDGRGGEHIEMDAFDFCRVLSGRGEGQGLLRWHVPF